MPQQGWAVAHVAGEGWRPCSPGDAGAHLDLDRYVAWQEHGRELLDGHEP